MCLSSTKQTSSHQEVTCSLNYIADKMAAMVLNNNHLQNTYLICIMIARPCCISLPKRQVDVRCYSLLFTGTFCKAVLDAHLRTCLYSAEQIDLLKSNLPSTETINTYKSMVSCYRVHPRPCQRGIPTCLQYLPHLNNIAAPVQSQI